MCSGLQIERSLNNSQTAAFECKGTGAHLRGGLGIAFFFSLAIKSCVVKVPTASMVALHRLSPSIANAEYVLEHLR